jgi:Flp pilus assembly protein TadB
MSKARARRREQRQAEAAVGRAARVKAAARARRRSAIRSALTAPMRQGRRETALRRHRGRQNGILAASLVAGHVALWLLTPSWLVRIGALVLTVLAWPVLIVLLFDRRPSA